MERCKDWSLMNRLLVVRFTIIPDSPQILLIYMSGDHKSFVSVVQKHLVPAVRFYIIGDASTCVFPWRSLSIPRMIHGTTKQSQEVRDDTDTKRDITTQRCVMETIVRDDTKR